MRKLIGTIVLAMLWVGLPAGTAAAARAPGLQCGQPITASVRLTHDLVCAHGFLVGDLGPAGPPTPITVDLGGYALRLTDPSGEVPCGLFARASCVISASPGVDLTVKDGTVSGPVGEAGGGLVLTHLRVEGDVFLDDQTLGVIDRVRSSHIDGLVLLGSGTDVITHDVIRGGIDVDDSTFSLDLTITDNLITGGRGDGIDLDVGLEPLVGGVIAGNVISHSAGAGISAPGQNLGGIRIDRNLLDSNGGDGITIGQPLLPPDGATATLTRNTATNNGGHGFDVTAVTGDTFVDGGHNHASGNALSPQCLGIVCTL
jgi:Right handed beta helix region